MRIKIIVAALASVLLMPASAHKYVGGDISLLADYEAHGAQYYDASGQPIARLLPFFGRQGLNAMRLRLFVDPSKATDAEKGEGVKQDLDYVKDLGRRIKEKWDVDMFATYSSTEMGATFSECEYGMGGHVHPELIIVEIIGEDNLPVPDGEIGEVVVTTLGVEGMPLLRFRTGDMAAKCVEQCRCGRNSYRLTPLVGRKNNMIKLKGTTLYPPAINDVLDNTQYVENYIIIVRSSDAGTDDVVVKVGLKYVPDFDVIKDLKDRFRSRIRVAPSVEVLPVDEIQALNFPAKSRKPVKFIDNRKKHE